MVETTERREFLAADEVGNKPEFACHVCGKCSYTWGTLSAQGINFKPDEASMLAKFFRFGTQLRARRCDECGNLQIFAQIPRAEGS